MRSTTLKTLILSLMVGIAPVVHADVLVMNNGSRLEGRVEEIPNKPDRISFLSITGRLEFNRSAIREIIDESDAEDWTRIGRQYLEKKDFSTATQMFQSALEADSTHEPALRGLGEAQQALTAIASEQASERDKGFETELISVGELITLEKFAEAQALLEKIHSQTSSDDQKVRARQLMRDLYLAWGEARYDRMDNRGAEENFQRVLEMDPENNRARERLLLIWRNDPAKKAEVLKAYEVKLRDDPNNIEYNRVVGDLYYELQRYAESIPLLARVAAAPAFARDGYDRKLLTAYNETILRLSNDNKLDEAIAYFREMVAFRPSVDATNLSMLEYRRDRQQLAEDDWQGKALLIRRLLASGLTETGRQEAELILRYDAQNEIATQILREMAEGELQRIQTEFAQGQNAVVIGMATSFIRGNTRFPALSAAADELKKKAEIAYEREARSKQQQARELAERGLEALNEAYRNAEMMASADVRSNVRPISYKQRSIELSRRAVEYLRMAIQIDPSLGDPLAMDLNTKLRDAQALLSSLTAAPYVPNRPPSSRFR